MSARRLAALCSILALSAGHPASAPGQSARADSIAAKVARGKALFHGKGLCFSCHGKEGEGLLAPSTRLVGRTLVHTKPTLADLVTLIKTGVDSAKSSIPQGMPERGGSRLSDVEVEAVAWYVLDLQKKAPPRK
jgi:mono/diheme cytochrome c family protein